MARQEKDPNGARKTKRENAALQVDKCLLTHVNRSCAIHTEGTTNHHYQPAKLKW